MQRFGQLERQLHANRVVLLWLGCAATIGVLALRVLYFGKVPYALTDFLVNYAGGPVRRGLAGQLALVLSDHVGGGPRFWALLVASVLCATAFGLAIRIYRRLPDDPAFLVLMLSPFGLLFLAYDLNGSIRKEIAGYIALLLVLQAGFAQTTRAARLWSGAGGAAFLGAIFLHEAILLLWPFLAAALWLVQRHTPALRRWCLGLGLGTGAGGLLCAVWLMQLPVPDPDAICRAARLVSCSGAIGWLTADLGDGIAYVISRRAWVDLPIYAAYAGLCLVPFAFVQLPGLPGWVRPMALVVAAGSVAPLFLLGYDWGRWLNMAAFPLSLLVAAAVALGIATWRRPFPPWIALAYLGSWSIPHANGGINYAALLIWPALGAVILVRQAWARL